MKKKLLINIIIGALVAIFLVNLAVIIISSIVGNGKFNMVNENLVIALNSEIAAVAFQFITVLILGGIIGGVSTLFQLENVNLLKIMIIHFITTFIAVYLIAYLNFWIDHDIIYQFFSTIVFLVLSAFPNTSVFFHSEYNYVGMIIYLLIFIIAYFSYWLISYFIYKRKVNKVNLALKTIKMKGEGK